MARLHQDDLVFYSMGETEEVAGPGHYEPGGYHPLIIGNIVQSPTGQSSYRILHKLGFGSYATVWLAEKLVPVQANTSSSSPSPSDSEPPESEKQTQTQYVALKVSTAENTPTKEAEFLGSFSSPQVIPLIDAFTLQGPNDSHSVIVTEILVPLSSYIRSSDRSARSLKKIAYDLSRAVAGLHQSGWVHGDLPLGNTGISIPQMASEELHDVMMDLDEPQLTLVLPHDIRHATPSLPAYVVAPCNMAKYYDRIVRKDKDTAVPEAKIFDFGNGGSQSPHHQTVGLSTVKLNYLSTQPMSSVKYLQGFNALSKHALQNFSSLVKSRTSKVRPWNLHQTSGLSVDWSLSLYPGIAMSPLVQMSLMGTGDPPAHWDGRFPAPPESEANNWWNEAYDHLKGNCSSDADCDALIRLLKRIFTLDPLKRPSAMEVCRDDKLV